MASGFVEGQRRSTLDLAFPIHLVIVGDSDIRKVTILAIPGNMRHQTAQAPDDNARIHNERRRQISSALSLGFVLSFDFRFKTSAPRHRPSP
jgi:hypothetical protein